MQKLALSFVACLLAVAAAGASAQSVWKWRDTKGQLHISDGPPPADVPEQNIVQRPSGARAPAAAPTAAAASPAASGVDSELEKKKARADHEKAEKDTAAKAELDKKNAAVKADNCQRAQAQVKALESGVRIARMDAKGERYYLDDKQRASELQHSQEIVQQSCK